MFTPSLMDDFLPWTPNLYLSTPEDSTMDTPLFHYLDDFETVTGPDFSTPLFPGEEVRLPFSKSWFDFLDWCSIVDHSISTKCYHGTMPLILRNNHLQCSSQYYILTIHSSSKDRGSGDREYYLNNKKINLVNQWRIIRMGKYILHHPWPVLNRRLDRVWVQRRWSMIRWCMELPVGCMYVCFIPLKTLS